MAADRAFRAATEAGFAAPAGISPGGSPANPPSRRPGRPSGTPAGEATRPDASAATRPRRQPSPPSWPTPTWPSTLDPPAPVAETAGAAAAAREAHDAANGAYATAKRTADQLALLAPKLDGRAHRPGPAQGARRPDPPDRRAGQRQRRQPVPDDAVQLRARGAPGRGGPGGQRAAAHDDGRALLAGALRRQEGERQGGPVPARLRLVDRRRPGHRHPLRRRDVPGQPRPRARPGRRGHRRGGGHPDGGALRRRGASAPSTRRPSTR